MNQFNTVKVFSATKAMDRDRLGDVVTEWIRANKFEVTSCEVRQSSDDAFHCLSITLFGNVGKR